MTKDAELEFLRLVVPRGTTECRLWAGGHDGDLRPVFRGEKAYRIMYERHNGDIPSGFHVHHKCENSACVNPRHLVALSPDDHRAVHATKNKAIKEQIYHGEWQKIQAAKAEAERLEQQRLEQQRLEQIRLAEERRKRAAAMAAEEARKHEERRKKRAVTLRKLLIYGTPVLACELLVLYCVSEFHWLSKNPIGYLLKWVSENPVSALVPLALLGLALVFFVVVLMRREQLRKKCAVVLRELHL
jgi:HNH endonuclease